MVAERIAGAPLGYAALRAQLEVPGDFAPDVVADAERSVRKLDLPDDDATELPLVTLDPAGSRDLDALVSGSTGGASQACASSARNQSRPA